MRLNQVDGVLLAPRLDKRACANDDLFGITKDTMIHENLGPKYRDVASQRSIDVVTLQNGQ